MAADAIDRLTAASIRSSSVPSQRGARRRARSSLRRPPRPPSGRPASMLRPASAPSAPASPAERDRRLDIAARALVRTIRACPAPGVPPLRRRDWLAISAVVAVPAAILFVASLAGR